MRKEDASETFVLLNTKTFKTSGTIPVSIDCLYFHQLNLEYLRMTYDHSNIQINILGFQ